MDTIEHKISLRYQLETPSGEHLAPSEYLLDARVKIIGHHGDPCSEVGLGVVDFTLIRVSLACESGVDLFTLFETRSDTMALMEELYGSSFPDFAPVIEREFPESFGHEDILLFSNIEVVPVARNQRVGLSALHRVARDWDGGCSLVVIDARSLLPSPSADQSDRVLQHFRGIGFRQISNSPFLLRSPKLQPIPEAELDLRNSVFLPKSLMNPSDPQQS